MPPAEQTDPGRQSPARLEIRALSLDSIASDVGRLRGALHAHAEDVLVRRGEDMAARAEMQAQLRAMATRLAAVEAREGSTARVEHKIDSSDALRDQDRRLLVLRVVLVLIPTLAAMVTPWLAARDVTVPPEVVQSIEAAVRTELAPGAPAAGPAAVQPPADPPTYGPTLPPATP